MFRFIYRTLFILLVAGLISGALFLFVSRSPDRTLALTNQIGSLAGRGAFPRYAQQVIFLASLQRKFRVGVAFWLALLDLAKNTLIIGLITAMVALLRRSLVAWKSLSGRGRLGK